MKHEYSLMVTLYSSWQEYSIPAVFYHYFLCIAQTLPKTDQIQLMTKQIQRLRNNNHPYINIMNVLEVREKSLIQIHKQIKILDNLTQEQFNWTYIVNPNQLQINKDIAASQILKFNGKQTKQSVMLLINHIKMYQTVTVKVIQLIHEWQQQIRSYNFKGNIQFLYRHQDYLQKITVDTLPIIQSYQAIFQKSPFFIMKQIHISSQYGLIYQSLKCNEELKSKIKICEEILIQHPISLFKNKIIAMAKQKGKISITKPKSLQKLYCNYSSNTDYYQIKLPFLYPDQNTNKKQSFLPGLRPVKLLINPQKKGKAFNTIQKRHPIYIYQNDGSLTERKEKAFYPNLIRDITLKRGESLQMQNIHGKPSILASKRIIQSESSKRQNDLKIKVMEQIDKTTRKFNILSPQINKMKPSEGSNSQKSQIDTQQSDKKQNFVNKGQLKFQYVQRLNEYDVVKYIQNIINLNNSLNYNQNQINSIARIIFKNKQIITLVKIFTHKIQQIEQKQKLCSSPQLLIGFAGVIFVEKGHRLKRTANIVIFKKVFLVEQIQQKLIKELINKGYGIIQKDGVTIHNQNIYQPHFQMLLNIKYNVSQDVSQQQMKKQIKYIPSLKHSRILKYYSYSKNTVYHFHCNHFDGNCHLQFKVEDLRKISVDGKMYLKAKVDSVKKNGPNYRIDMNFNDFYLIIAKSIQSLCELAQKQTFQDFEDQQQNTKIDYVCFQPIKQIHRYLKKNNQILLNEIISIGNDDVSISSIDYSQQKIKNTLIIKKPYALGLFCSSKAQNGKSLSLISID